MNGFNGNNGQPPYGGQWNGQASQGAPQYPPQGAPQYPPQGAPQYPPQGAPQYPPQDAPQGQGYAQPQAAAPIDLNAVFRGFNEATVEGRLPKLLDVDGASPITQAQFRLRWEHVAMESKGGFEGRRAYTQFRIECTVLQTNHPERAPGSRITITENGLTDNPQRAMGNIKGWVAAALSHKLGQVVDPNSQQDWMGVINQVVGQQYLNGAEFVIDASKAVSKNGRAFIMTNASPVPELLGYAPQGG